MSVGADDIVFCSSAVGSSSGGASTGVAYSNAKNAFFPATADVDRLAGGSIVRKWFVTNESGLFALVSPSVWIQQEPTFETEEIGLGWNSSDDADSGQGNMTAFSTNAKVALSSSASDTRTVTIVGLSSTAVPTSEDVVLNGTTPVQSTTTWSVVYGVAVSATSLTLTVTVKEGLGGTTRGTIGTSKKCCWLWIEALNKGTGIHLPDLPSGGAYGFWDRITWPVGMVGVRPNISVVAVEEN